MVGTQDMCAVLSDNTSLSIAADREEELAEPSQESGSLVTLHGSFVLILCALPWTK